MLKNIFKKKNNSLYYYIYETKKSKTFFYMKDKLTFSEKIHNSNSLKKTSITSVKQGKKIFFRFLKNNKIFPIYLRYIVMFHMDIDKIIAYNFASPFSNIIENLCYRHNNIIMFSEGLKHRDIFNDLTVKWAEFLLSINYFNNETIR